MPRRLSNIKRMARIQKRGRVTSKARSPREQREDSKKVMKKAKAKVRKMGRP